MSKFKKTLHAIVLTSIIGLSGCGTQDEVTYKINNEKVRFYRDQYGCNEIEAIKPNGKRVVYSSGTDFKVDYISIEDRDGITSYRDDEFGKPILEEAQKQFDEYLKVVLPNARQKALNKLE